MTEDLESQVKYFGKYYANEDLNFNLRKSVLKYSGLQDLFDTLDGAEYSPARIAFSGARTGTFCALAFKALYLLSL